MKNSFQWQFVDNFDFPLKIQSSYCLQIVGDHKTNSALNIWSTDNIEIAEVDNSDSALTIRSNDNIETAGVNNHDSAVEINHVKDNTETV